MPYVPTFSPQRLQPVLDRICRATDSQEVHEYVEANENVSKTVLKLPQ